MQYIFQKKRHQFKIGTITCIGHSLGGALALLAGYDLGQEAIIPAQVKVRVCNFEAPKVGEIMQEETSLNSLAWSGFNEAIELRESQHRDLCGDHLLYFRNM